MTSLPSNAGIVFRSPPPPLGNPPPLPIIRGKKGGVGEALLASSLVNLLQRPLGRAPLTSTSLTKVLKLWIC